MLMDSITLASGGALNQLPVPNGAAFPDSPGLWTLFRLTATVGQNAPGFYTYDGSAWQAFGVSADPVYPYDIATSTYGKPAASEVVLRVTTNRAFSLDAVTGRVGTVPTGAAAVFTVLKNGSSVGTLSFGIGVASGTSTVPATSFASGDVISITAPVTQNSTLADLDLFLKGHAL